MEPIKNISEIAKIAKNPLGIIALFIILCYGFASLVLGAGSLEPSERWPFVWFLVLFPVFVLIVFAWLASSHHAKLYAPKDYTTDKSFLDATTHEHEHNMREDIDCIGEKVEKIIHDVVTSQEFIGKLQQLDGHEEAKEVLKDIASKASKELINSAFVEIDAREFTGDQEKFFSLPVSAFSNLNDFTDKVYYNIKPLVEPMSYGTSWLLVNTENDNIIKSTRMITNSEPGKRVVDNRALSEVGIKGGTKLFIKSPKKS